MKNGNQWLTRSVVPNLFHSVAPDQYVIIFLAPFSTFYLFQIQLLLVMYSIMVPISVGQDHFMEDSNLWVSDYYM